MAFSDIRSVARAPLYGFRVNKYTIMVIWFSSTVVYYIIIIVGKIDNLLMTLIDVTVDKYNRDWKIQLIFLKSEYRYRIWTIRL